MRSLTRWVRRSMFVFLHKSFNVVVIVALLLQPVGTAGVYGAFSFSRGVPIATAADTEPATPVVATSTPGVTIPPKESVVVPAEETKPAVETETPVLPVVPSTPIPTTQSIGDTGATTDTPSTGTVDPSTSDTSTPPLVPVTTPPVTPQTTSEPAVTTLPSSDAAVISPVVTTPTDSTGNISATGDLSGQTCLSNNTDLKKSVTSDWNVNEVTGKAETKDSVKLGVVYEFPLNQNVRVTFTCLPKDPSKLTQLSIEQIKASDIMLPSGTVAVSPYAYDITTDGMENGTFQYDVTFPKVASGEAQISYIEKSADEIKGKELNKNEIKQVSEKNIDNKSETVNATSLDHFTTFLLTQPVQVTVNVATTTGSCMADQHNAPKNLTCTASDISLAQVSNIQTIGHECRFPGDTVTFSADWKVTSTSQDRYNIGLWFASQGQTSALHGQCSITSLPNSPAPFFESSTDACGDIHQGSATTTITMSATCIDTQGTNMLSLPYCTSWDQSENACAVPTDTVPGSPSKCSCDTSLQLPITVPYGAKIEVKKVLSPSNDTGKFNLQIDGTTEAANVGNNGTTGSVVVGAGTSVAPGADHTVEETAGTATGLDGYISDISCVDRGKTTFNGGAPLMLDESGPLTVHVNKDQDVVCTITNTKKPGDSCGYPYASQNPKTSAIFNESEVLRDFSPRTSDNTIGAATIKAWYNDEHALTLGVRQVDSTSYTVSPLSTNPGHVNSPATGATVAQGGVDVTGRPMWPALYITDITSDPNNTSGDWQSGGTPFGPTDIFGTWKAAVKSGTSVTPDADPSKNNWSLGAGSDPVPTGLTNQGYGAEVRWDVNNLIAHGFNFQPGHTYRFQFIVHDGDQNKVGGDSAEACTTITAEQVAPQPTLTLVKQVVNTNGGTVLPTAWTLTATGPVTISGATGSANVTNASVSAGTYTLSETGGPQGYSASSWVCTGTGSQNANQITLALGESATCTITNTDQAGHLLVHKVTNPTDTTTAFSITATGGTISGNATQSITGGSTVDYTVAQGTYSVSEASLTGWDQTGNTCTNISINVGETKECTITNTKRAVITVTKDAIPNDAQDFTFTDNFGNGNPTSFLLDDDSNATLPNTRNFEVLPGTYAVTESATAGWKQVSTTCAGNIVVNPGDHVTCLFTNEKLGSITIIKNTLGGNDTFGFSMTGNTLPTSAQITTVNGTGTQTFTGIDPDNTYSIAEDSLSGWDLTNTSCINTTSTGSQTSRSAASFSITNGGNVTCTFTNTKKATLTLRKTVTNDNGGTALPTDFQGKIDGTNVAWGVAQEVSFGSHTASETNLPGYTASVWGGDCAANGTVTLSAGENKTCAITNNDNPPTLTLNKVVVNDNGGTATESAWTLIASGPTTLSGQGAAGSTDVVSGVSFSAGKYTLSETGGPTGYTASGWSCTNGVSVNTQNQITLGLGQSTVCSITNDDQPAHLIVKKHVVNDNGGTKTASDFNLTVTNSAHPNAFTGDENGTDVVVNAGTYSISENAVAGYTMTGNDCTGTIASGETKTCTVTNDDNAPALTLVKTVENDNGGTALATDWTLTASGPTGFSGPGPQVSSTGSFEAGTYTLTESGPDGYTPSNWICTGTGVQQIGSNVVTLGLGQSATCTIVNDDIAPALTLVKTVINDNGGTALPTDWTLTATGPTPLSGNGLAMSDGSFQAGTYTLSEAGGPAGYTAGTWSCAKNNHAPVSGDSVTIGLGDTVLCSLTNDDVPAQLTVIKHLINENGGNNKASDFTMNVSGTSVSIPSFSGSEAGTTVTLNAGEYSVTESGPLGYAESDSTDCKGTIQIGEHKMCTITNNDIDPTLTVVKTVVNDHGGTLQVADFPLFVDGNQVTSGVPTTLLSNHTYTVTETNKDGYTPSVWGGDCASDGTITLNEGENKTCTITNTDQAGHLLVHKVTNPTDTTTAFSITATGGTISGNATQSITGGSFVDYTVAQGTYSVSEASLTGWDQTDNTCTNLSINVGETKECTITNTEKGHLIVEKTTLPSGDQTEFSITVTGSGTITNDGTGTVTDATDQDFEVTPGTYSVAEDVPVGWDKTGDTCQDVAVSAGRTVTCLLTNTKRGSITIVKDAQPNDPQDFRFTGSLGEFFLDDDGDNQDDLPNTKTVADLVPGTYTVAEPNDLGKAWDLTDITCVGGSDTNAHNRNAVIKLQPGEDITCTFTNTAVAPKLTVIKVVDNGNTGATFKPSDFQMMVDGAAVDQNVANNQTAGNHTVSESGPDGYTASYSTDCTAGTVSLALGDDKTCTVTNTAIAPTLKLVKNVTNDNGGKYTASDWTLTASGVNGFSDGGDSTTFYTVNAGVAYSLSESTIPGYAAGAWTCDGGTVRGDTVTLNLAQNVTCSITNNDIAPTVTVVKNVVNDNGGTATVDDFGISFTGGALAFGSGVSNGTTTTYTSAPVAVDANTQYTLSENTVTGYVAGSWSCTNNQSGTGTSLDVTLQEGQDITCTITNDDIAPTITLIKNVEGGTADANDFGLSVGGVGVESGVATVVTAHTPIALDETGRTGYTFASISGDAGCPVASGGTVDLSEGQNITCTITNIRDTGSIIVHKVIDRDGNLATTDDQTIGANWAFGVSGTEKDLSDPLSGSTDGSGAVTFDPVKTGLYNITETPQSGYDLISATCGDGNGNKDNDTVYSVGVSKDTQTVCTFYNTPNGTLHGYKWNDLDGDGQKGVDEPLLPGWTINLYAADGNGGYNTEPTSTMVTDSGNQHFGWYWFEHLFPGNYKVCETPKQGWTQTYPINDEGNCHFVTLPDGNSNGFPVSQNYVTGPEYNFGNHFIPPVLNIQKFNAQWPTLQTPGDVVDYTIIVTALENTVYDVNVQDLLPAGFEYVPGSGSSTQGSMTKVYASPGMWSLGTLKAGDTATITYQAKIGSAADPGTYKDLAWAQGADDNQGNVLATSVEAGTRPAGNDDTGVVSDTFVGTQIALALPTSLSVKLPEKEKTDTTVKHKIKRVLGASTLPATGANGWWLVLALGVLILGMGMIWFARKKKNMSMNNSQHMMTKLLIAFVFGVGALFLPVSAHATGSPHVSVRVETPKSPTDTNAFKIGFVVLDIDGATPTVTCAVDNGGGFLPFPAGHTEYVAHAGGNSGNCVVDGTVMPTDGTYAFRVTAVSSDTVSQTVTVEFASTAPSTPLNYNRDKNSCTMSFTTANDGVTTGVELYRSPVSEFTADASTYIGTLSIGPNTSGTMTDSTAGCGGDTFYALRAINSAGAGSDFVGDNNVTVHHKTKTKTTTKIIPGQTLGALPVKGGTVGGGANGAGTGNEGAVQGAETENTQSPEGSVLGAETGLGGWWSWVKSHLWGSFFGLLVLIILAYAFYRSYQKKQNENESL